MIFSLEVNLCFAIIVLIADGFDVSTYVHVDTDFGFLWLNSLNKVCKNHFCSCFVEDFPVSEGVDVDFE